MGKYRHLSRAATAGGHFVIMAIDHRDILLDSLNEHAPVPLSDADFTDFKQAVLRALAPYTSAVLVDPAYGIGRGITSGVISGRTGILAPIEAGGYGSDPNLSGIEFTPDWSVKKIKLSGGDGVKLLLPYHPDALNAARKQAVVRQLVEECAAYDIPFFLEPIPHALDADSRLTNEELLQINVANCQMFSAMGVDILKLPFPVDTHQSQDEAEWLRACQVVNAACSVPWALLSAGVNYETFLRQSKIASQAGASGVIVGRAVWAEAAGLQGEALAAFLTGVAAERMRELGAVFAADATPWHKRVAPPLDGVGWYTDYPA
jgi:tagatose-1,6-bisphosphate aldolase